MHDASSAACSTEPVTVTCCCATSEHTVQVSASSQHTRCAWSRRLTFQNAAFMLSKRNNTKEPQWQVVCIWYNIQYHSARSRNKTHVYSYTLEKDMNAVSRPGKHLAPIRDIATVPSFSGAGWITKFAYIRTYRQCISR